MYKTINLRVMPRLLLPSSTAAPLCCEKSADSSSAILTPRLSPSCLSLVFIVWLNLLVAGETIGCLLFIEGDLMTFASVPYSNRHSEVQSLSYWLNSQSLDTLSFHYYTQACSWQRPTLQFSFDYWYKTHCFLKGRTTRSSKLAITWASGSLATCFNWNS